MKPRRMTFRRTLVLLLFALGLGLFGVALAIPPAPNHAFFRPNDDLLVIAHQGGNLVRPDNTLVAFDHAVDLGVDVLEMDISPTRDGALVVMHDLAVDRTTNGQGDIAGLTLAQIKALDAAYRWTPDDGQTFPYRGQQIQVPTLEEVLIRYPTMRFNIELKSPTPDGLVGPFCEVVRRLKVTDQVLVASFHAATMDALRQECPELATSGYEREIQIFFGLNLIFLGGAYPAAMEAFQVPEYSGSLHVVTQRFVQGAHRQNLDVHVWTVNEREQMERLVTLGVDGIITDRPDLLLDVLGRP